MGRLSPPARLPSPEAASAPPGIQENPEKPTLESLDLGCLDRFRRSWTMGSKGRAPEAQLASPSTMLPADLPPAWLVQ